MGEGQCLKSCNVVLQAFENDGVQKKKRKKINTLYLDGKCLFVCFKPYLSSIYEKANCIAFFGRDVRTRLGVAISEVSGPPAFHIKTGASRYVPCPRAQQTNLPACSTQPRLNTERQAGKLWIPFFEVFWCDSTRGLNPKSTDCEADALTTTLMHRFKLRIA